MDSITRKTLLYKTGVEHGSYCINHVEGCAHGCLYPCYAMLIKKRAGRIKDYDDWRKPKIVSNALELLEKEVLKLKSKISYVHLCFSTDPFMYGYKDIAALSLEIIKRLNEQCIPCTTLTKGIYPVDSMQHNDLTKNNEYGITIVSLDESFRKDYEPYAATLKDRLHALRQLAERGFKTWVSLEPYPTPNIIRQDLTKILDAVSFVNEIWFGRLNYNKKVSKFKFYKEFYKSQVEFITEFCKKNKISVYVK
ncbi:MAG: radical SAM protein [Nitrospirae bacterium]|nr:radical SAM protein [Nitrospirota bacterium]